MKYFLSVCCIIKDEKYLEEFIMYNYLIGVEHFYIYDNESKIPIKDRLSNDFFKGLCTIINYPGKAQQNIAYNDFLKKYGNETEWAIVIDGDEYILPKKHDSLNDFLKDYADYDSIGINWVMYGTSFHDKIQRGFQIENYKLNAGVQNQHIKTICKPNTVVRIDNPHYVIPKNRNKNIDPYKRVISGPFNTNPTIDLIQINHYWSRSYEDLKQKIERGRAPTTAKRSMPSNPHNDANKVSDNLINEKYLEKMKELKKKYNIKFLNNIEPICIEEKKEETKILVDKIIPMETKVSEEIKVSELEPIYKKNDKDMFYRYLNKSKNYFEFGSGGSTYQASIRPNIEKIVSVESDKEWYDKLKEIVSHKNFNFKYIETQTLPKKWGYPGEKATDLQKKSYSNVIVKLGKVNTNKIDFLLIDGRYRVACCLKCFDMINDDCVIAFNDFLTREQYNVVLKYYDIIEKTEDNTMVIMKKKKDSNKPKKEEISKYELVPN